MLNFLTYPPHIQCNYFCKPNNNNRLRKTFLFHLLIITCNSKPLEKKSRRTLGASAFLNLISGQQEDEDAGSLVVVATGER